jgi:hypothetical protein
MSSLARASGKDEDAGVGDGDWVGVDEGLMAKTMMRRTPAPRASRASRRGGAEVGEEQLNRSGGSTNRRRDVRASTFIFEISELFLHAPRSELRTAQHRTRETREQRQQSPTVTATCMRPQYLPFTSLPFTLTELHLLKARQYSTGPCPMWQRLPYHHSIVNDENVYAHVMPPAPLV